MKHHDRLSIVADIRPAQRPEDEFKTPWGRVWTHGSDVMATWRKQLVNGKPWVPPSEVRSDFLFKQNRDKVAK
jgi:hypothetical protein